MTGFLKQLLSSFRYQWQRDHGAVALVVVQDPERKRP